jgi:hypothetical protein
MRLCVQQREIDRAAEFCSQWFEAITFRGWKTHQARLYVGVDFFGVGEDARGFRGSGVREIDQAKPDLEISFHQLNAYPVVRGRSVSARHTGPSFLSLR